MLNDEVIELIKEKFEIQNEIQKMFSKIKHNEDFLDMDDMIDTKNLFDKMDKIQKKAIGILENNNKLYINYMSLVNSLNDDDYESASVIKNRILNDQQK